MVRLNKYWYLMFGVAVFVFWFTFGYAADFDIYPQTGTFGSEQEFEINLKIDSAGETINAAQAKLNFPANIIEIKNISKDGSIFNFWLGEPEFSNTDGTIEFIAGTTNGVSGSSLQVLKITFKAKGIGSSDISFIDSSITAADGSGTNILSKSNGASFIISSTSTIPKSENVPIPTPVPVTRKPAQATGLPTTPSVSIALYPNPANWYNFVSQFTPAWNLPPDVSGLNTAFNTNPNFVVPPDSEGLFEAKTLPAISEDGIYYFHTRFQNNKGWGSTIHYRIAVDTQPPIPFKIEVKTGLISDNPSPKLAFNTNDSLSGVDHYDITVNSEEAVVIRESEYSLLPRQPGEYVIRVRAFDKAGNSIEDVAKIEILPIETPQITSINKKIILGSDDSLRMKGLAILGTNTIITIEDQNEFLVLQEEVATNPQGEWEFRLDRELRRGDYFVTVKARDSRGALSLSTGPIKVSYVEKAVISLFGLDVTLRGLIIILVIAGVLATLWFWRKTLLHLTKSQRESVIISRDLKNAFDLVKKDVDKMVGTIKNDVSADEKELEVKVISKNIGDTLDKIEKYLSKDIEQLK